MSHRVVARHRIWRRLVALPAFLLALALGPVAHAAPAHPGTATTTPLTCGIGWQLVPSPTVTGEGGFTGVVPIPGTTQLWAVGGQLIERWSGTAWSVVPTPTVSGGVVAVSTDAANDAWAVGAQNQAASNLPQPFTEHWNGTAWSVVSSPIPTGMVAAYLYSVAAVAPDDAWAVGYQRDAGTSDQPLIEHWNGVTWSVVTGAPTLSGGVLNAVTRILGTVEVVAVGSHNPTYPYGLYPGGVFIEQWSGSKWARMPAPNGGGPSGYPSDSVLFSVRAISPTNIWAAGRTSIQTATGSHPYQNLIEQWNGTNWVVSPAVNSATNGVPEMAALNAITTVNGTDIVAVGWTGPTVGSGVYTTSQQGNGSTWTPLTTLPLVRGATYAELYGVAHIPGTTQIWAVGTGGPNGNLIEVRC